MTKYVNQFKIDLAEWHKNHKSAIKARVDLKGRDESGNKNRFRVNARTGIFSGEYV
jgi:hypothetical protein